ncbi:MAG TPA: RNA methyltransferase, partial [Fodinibius sp.]|nr:RNA methyltransferase [Fodinibius sp.]
KKKLIKHLQQFVTSRRLETINRVLDKRTRYLSVVLEDLYQPHNASAVLRSCDGFGIQDMHIIENENRFRPAKGVTIGSDQWITQHKYNIEGKNNTERCYQRLRDKGYRIIATTPHEEDVTIDELPLEQKTALVFGSELTGLTDYAMDCADGYARIAMKGFSESFNISVSAALCLYELSTRMRRQQNKWSLNETEKTDLRLEWLRTSIREVGMIERRFLSEQSG